MRCWTRAAAIASGLGLGSIALPGPSRPDADPSPAIAAAPSTATRQPEREPAAVTRDAIRYVLAWSDDGVVRRDDGVSLTTDRGFEVHVEAGRLVTRAVSLVPCRVDDVAPDPWAELRSAWIGDAQAGHAGIDDPSAFAWAWPQSLVDPSDATLPAIDFPARRYCRAHVLVARAPGGADDASLLVQARVRGADDRERTLSIRSRHAHGVLLDLPQPPEDGATDLVITRRLAGLFDGIDLDTAGDREIERAVLTNALAGTTLSWASP